MGSARTRVFMTLVMALFMVLGSSAAAFAGPDDAPSEDQEQRSEQQQEQRGNQKQQDDASQESSGDDDSYGGQGCDGSHGSDTGHGANTDGDDNEYHNTCDGTASDNGNDQGSAKGRPCAGCVGNADDKNPPGQYRNGDDANNGYECDGNNGVGGKKSSPAAGNPAHTGCTTPPADECEVNCGPPPTCPPNDAACPPPYECPPGDETCVPPRCPPGSKAAHCVSPELCPDGSEMSPSGKCNEPPKMCPDGSPMPPSGTCVRGIIIERDEDPSFPPLGGDVDAEVVRGAPDEPDAVAGAILPVTGADAFSLLFLASLSLSGGGLLLARRSKKS